MINRDRKILIGELRLKAGLALIIFVSISFIIAIITGISIAFGSPAGIIERACFAIAVVFILDALIFRKIFLIVVDLIRAQKVQIHYDGILRTIDKPEFIDLANLLSKLSRSGNFDKIDFNHSFKTELSRWNKEILYIEQFDKVIFPKDVSNT